VPKNQSGYQQRKEFAAKEAEYESNQREREDLGYELPEVPKPPRGVGSVAWANRVACVLLIEIRNDKVINTKTRVRFVSDLVGKIGITHAKALAEERINNLKHKVGIKDKPLDIEYQEAPESADEVLACANREACDMLYQVMTDEGLKAEDRWRMASDLIGKIGTTHAKSLTEKEIKKLEKKIGLDKQAHDDDGLEDDPEA
jgi:hypothetical protein